MELRRKIANKFYDAHEIDSYRRPDKWVDKLGRTVSLPDIPNSEVGAFDVIEKICLRDAVISLRVDPDKKASPEWIAEIRAASGDLLGYGRNSSVTVAVNLAALQAVDALSI